MTTERFPMASLIAEALFREPKEESYVEIKNISETQTFKNQIPQKTSITEDF